MKKLFARAQRLGPVLLLLLYVNCKGEKTEPGFATTIVANTETSISGFAGAAVSPAPSVIVRDQNGNPMGGSIVTFAVTGGGGSVTDPTVTTNASGIATVGSWTLGGSAGTNVLTASVGSLTVTFNATAAAGATATLTKSAGDGQVATAGSSLPIAPSVIVKDASGNVKSGVIVTFAVGSGGGSVTGGTATSNTSGVATVASWTLGTIAGTNSLVASTAGVPSVTFNATGTAGTAGTLTKSTGDAQVATAGTTVPVAPSVVVKDGNGNVKSGVVVTFAVGAGGGSVTGGTATSDAAGVATVGSWTLGTIAGTNSLVASTAGVPSVTFNATGAVGAAGTLTKSAGDGQVATAGTTLPIAPSVIVKDGNGNVKSGVVVTFAVGVGGGSVAGGTVTSNASGVAAAGGWTLGTSAGSNTLVASAAGVPSVTFTAVASSPLCSVRATHTFGTTTSGTLSTTDCQLPDGTFADFFTTTVPSAGAYLFKEGAAFDAYLLLEFPDGTKIAENDDESQSGTNSSIKALLPAGSYLFVPGSLSPGVTGDYEISSRATSTNVGNCELVFAVKGIATDQNIAATDCLFTTAPAAPIYGDAILIFLRAGQSVTLNMASSTIDSFLELARLDGGRVAQNDNKDATTKDAQITYTATETSYYAIFARTSSASQTGAYTLTIQ